MSRTHSTRIGSHEVIAITDGEHQFGAELFPGTDAERISELLASAGASTIDTNFNAFVIKSSGRTMLVDAGPRDLMGPASGNLPAGLVEAGIAPADITHLLLTHLHPDHIAGALSTGGAAVFENAVTLINEKELAFWCRDEAFGDEHMDQWQQLAKVVVSAYGDRVQTFSDDADLGDGLTALALPGHTPGHTGFQLNDGDESLLMACDIVHAPALQLADPEIAIAFDIDADTARATRKRILDMVATEQLLFAGGHLTQPKFGQLQRAGSGYELV